jgi:hypothetical protein
MASESIDDPYHHSTNSNDVNEKILERPSIQSQGTPLQYYLPYGNGEVVSPRMSYLSPDGETPRRILSCQSLVGEDISTEWVESSNTTRKSGVALTSQAEMVMDVELSPFTPTTPVDDDDDIVLGDGINSNSGDDDDATTPPAGLQQPVASLSPPLLTTYTPSSTGRSIDTEDGSVRRSSRPHPPPSQPYLQHRPRTSYPLPYASTNLTSSAAVMRNTTTANSVIDSSMTQMSVASSGRPPSRPPRAPQASPLVHSSFSRHSEGRQSMASLSHQHQHQHQQPETLPLHPVTASQGMSGVGGGHTRTHTDNTNFTFLSALTDVTGEFAAPKRRTLSWDNLDDTHQQFPASKKDLRNRAAVSEASIEHYSPGGGSMPGSILQPILTDNDPVSVAPPISIWASTLRKATPTPGTPPQTSIHQREYTCNDSVQVTTVDKKADGLPTKSLSEMMSENHDRSDLGLLPLSTNDHDLHTVGGALPNGAESVCESILSVHCDEKKESSDRISPGETRTSYFPMDLTEISKPHSHSFEPSSGPTDIRKRISLDDFLEATNQDMDEADIIQIIDLSQHLNDTRNIIAQLLPQLSHSMVQDNTEPHAEHKVNDKIDIPLRRQFLDASVQKGLLWILLCSIAAATILDSRWLSVLVLVEIIAFAFGEFSDQKVIGVVINHTTLLRIFGKAPLLVLAQSKGWPYFIFVRGIVGLILLALQQTSGSYWLFGKRWILIFSEEIFSVYTLSLHKKIICIYLGLGVATTIKRALMAIFVARTIVGKCHETTDGDTLYSIGYHACSIYDLKRCLVSHRLVNYRVELNTVKKKLLLLSEVAELSVRRTEETASPHNSIHNLESEMVRRVDPLDMTKQNGQNQLPEITLEYNHDIFANANPRNIVKKSLCSEEQIIARLIEECEDAAMRIDDHSVSRIRTTFHFAEIPLMNASDNLSMDGVCLIFAKEVTLADILQFCHAMEFINTEYPISSSFGRVNNRKESVDASQIVFERLAKGNEVVTFDVLCRIAVHPDSRIDAVKIRELIQLFHPSKNRIISKLDFMKSIDR